MDVKKIWLITGVSRGLGKELAKAVAARGHIVVGTSRDGFCDLNTPLDHLEVLPMELSSAPQIQSVVDHVLARFGRIDVLVNNAGYGLMSAIEEASEEELARVYEVNLFGPLRLVRAVLPALRAQKSGHIINVSSIAATAPGAGSGLYASAKSAVEGFSESLALEMAPLGVSVSIVVPGVFRTDFFSDHSLRKSKAIIGDYAQSAGATREFLTKMGARNDQIGDPARGAQAIIELNQLKNPPLRLLLGSDCLRRMREKLKKRADEMEAWKEVTASTDFPP